VKIDPHGYYPREIIDTGLFREIVRQAWEMGEDSLTFVHGHGRNRGISPGFVNANTGYFGLRIREALRCDESLRQWIFYTTLDRWDMGSTTVRLKPNPEPTRKKMDWFRLSPPAELL
jgi:hypothetical protein